MRSWFKKTAWGTLIWLSASTALAQGMLMMGETSQDVTGKDAADARALALTQAEQDAFAQLAQQLQGGNAASFDPKAVSAAVRGVEVLEEKIAGNRYRARLRVSYDATEVNKMLGIVGAAGAPTAPATGLSTIPALPPATAPSPAPAAVATAAPPAPATTPAAAKAAVPQSAAQLVLPVFEEKGNLTLWEDNSPWRQMWMQLGVETGSGAILLPFGDNRDMSVVDAKSLLSANASTLEPFFTRYGVGEVVVLLARMNDTTPPSVDVVSRRLAPGRNEVNIHTYNADPQETRETLLQRAASEIIEQMRLKKESEVQTSNVANVDGKTMVVVPVKTLSGWTQLRTRLMKLPAVQRLELLAIAPQQIDLLLHYRGDPQSLASAISAQGLRVTPGANYWVIARD